MKNALHLAIVKTEDLLMIFRKGFRIVREDKSVKITKSKKRIVIIILLCLIIVLIAGWWVFSVSIYNENFNKRFESYEPYILYVEDYEDLSCSEYTLVLWVSAAAGTSALLLILKT